MSWNASKHASEHFALFEKETKMFGEQRVPVTFKSGHESPLLEEPLDKDETLTITMKKGTIFREIRKL